MASGFTHSVRDFELSRTQHLLPREGALLEIGAGDGWQAKQLETRYRSVTAIDIPGNENIHSAYFPVTHYDGTRIPFGNETFDAVYTSNVLEHVDDFRGLNDEIQRILKPNGIAVHCLPTATWRIWTSLGHSVYVLKWAYKIALSRLHPEQTLQAGKVSFTSMNRWALIRLALFSPRHGEHGSVASEVWLFSRRRWEIVFKENGWKVIHYAPSRIFYTGNEIFGLNINNYWRSTLSRILGSSTHIFVLKK